MNNYYQMLNEFLDYFKKEYGERRYSKIENKIFDSRKVSNMITLSRQKKLVPNHNDYVQMLHEIPYFIFSNRETVACGSFIAIERWNLECNKNNQLASDYDLALILRNILNEVRQL